MPRPKLANPTVPRLLKIDKAVDEEVRELLWDPTLGRVTYGSYGKLVTRLLREYVNNLRHEPMPKPKPEGLTRGSIVDTLFPPNPSTKPDP